jgi:2-iminobutanoate/2-iminopropanoate deaminase
MNITHPSRGTALSNLSEAGGLRPTSAQCILLVLALFLPSSLAAQAPNRPISPTQTSSHPNRFYSPGVDAGDYLYISGQGPRRPDGNLPPTFDAQVHQALDNIKAIVEAAGLTMDHVVYTQVYLEDMAHYAEMNEVFAGYFANKTPPARAVLGVARVPDPPIQITAVAVRNLADRKAIHPPKDPKDDAASPAILTHDLLFVSSMSGTDPATGKVPDDPAAQVDLALNRLQSVLTAAGLDFANMVFVNPYLTAQIPMRVMNEHYARRFEFGNTPARATIEVSSLPGGAHIEYTGVAVRDLSQRKAVRPKNMPSSPTASPCVFAGEILFCSAKSGFIPGPHGGVFTNTTPVQLRQTMRNQLDNLEETDMRFDQVVSTTIYLDNLSDQQSFDEVYAQYFGPDQRALGNQSSQQQKSSGSPLPARTVVQQIAPADRKPDPEGHYPDLEQVSLIAIRSHPTD